MAVNRKERERHPSTNIPDEVIADINYRVHLLRLEPPMTPAESLERSYETTDRHGKPVIQNDATRRASAQSMASLTRAYLRVLVDKGMIAHGWPDHGAENNEGMGFHD